jgi:hypothetical protein
LGTRAHSKARDLAARIASAGLNATALVDAQADVEPIVVDIFFDGTPWKMRVLAEMGGCRIAALDLSVTYSYYGAATEKLGERAFRKDEAPHLSGGETTGDLYQNPDAYLSNVPLAVRHFELGDCFAVRTWLVCWQENRRDGRPLTIAEKDHLRYVIQHLAALIALGDELNGLYEEGAASAFRGGTWAIEVLILNHMSQVLPMSQMLSTPSFMDEE